MKFSCDNSIFFVSQAFEQTLQFPHLAKPFHCPLEMSLGYNWSLGSRDQFS